jgi:membrane protein DedA with SNARE-associated domain
METQTIQQIISDYGYWALFAGTFMEGETFFILGGIAARQGILNPWYVALAALSGGFIGDQVFFLLGKWRGVEVLASSRRMARKAVRVRKLVRRHALALMLLSRFLYGFRMVIPLACGTSGIHWITFLALNFLSAVAWTLMFGGLGYMFGGWVTQHMDFMTALPKLAGAVVLVLALTFVVGRFLRRSLLGETDVDGGGDGDVKEDDSQD